jgi:DNA-binding NarL/FixJ family response regulator
MSDVERCDIAGSTATLEVAQPLKHLTGRRVRLTPRECDVARGVANGLTNKRMARDLGISEFTVRDHVSALLRKCETATRTRLAVLVSSGMLLGDDLFL